jgi:hypothetical protein
MATINRYRFSVGFRYGRYFGTVIGDAADPADYSIGEKYAESLKADLQPRVTSGRIETYPRHVGETGGPGIEFDFVGLLTTATFVAGSYAGWRVLADDLRSLIGRLRELGDGPVYIDEYTAQVLAVDYVSDPATFSDISLRYVAKVRGWDDDEPDADRGYLVGQTVNGADCLVVVSVDGHVLGVSRDVNLDGISSLGL